MLSITSAADRFDHAAAHVAKKRAARPGFHAKGAAANNMPTRILPATQLQQPVTPSFQIVSGAAFIASAPPRPLDLVDGLIPAGALAMLVAPPGGFKTHVALEIVRAVNTGTSAFGLMTSQQGVAVLVEEEHRHPTLAARLAQHGLASNSLGVVFRQSFRLDDPRQVSALAQQVAGAALLVLDPLVEMHIGDENSGQDMGLVVDGLRALQRVNPAMSILVLHHVPKAASGNPASLAHVRGHTRTPGAFDVVLEITPTHDVSPPRLRLSCTKSKDDAMPRPLDLEVDLSAARAIWRVLPPGTGPRSASVPQSPSATELARVMNALCTKGPQPSFDAIAKAAGIKKARGVAAAKALIASGQIVSANGLYCAAHGASVAPTLVAGVVSPPGAGGPVPPLWGAGPGPASGIQSSVQIVVPGNGP